MNNVGDRSLADAVKPWELAERDWYAKYRPCTVFVDQYIPSVATARNGINVGNIGLTAQGNVFIGNPAGGALANWDAAVARLDAAVDLYREYRRALQRLGTRCCPEYLHIVGFSDGATTISKWLNSGRPQGDAFNYGLILTIDLVRTQNVDANRVPHASYHVQRSAPGAIYRNIANIEPFRGFAGREFPGWANDSNRDRTLHANFPKHATVQHALRLGIYEALPARGQECECRN